MSLPGTKPEKFAPGVVSKSDRHEFGSVFSSKGDECFIGVDRGTHNEVLYSKLTNGVWAEPKVLLTRSRYGYHDPMLTADDQRLYVISNQNMDDALPTEHSDIWYLERTADGWGSPIQHGSNINSDFNEYYISFADNGDMYFSSNKDSRPDNRGNYDIYRSAYSNGSFKAAEKLGSGINTGAYEADVCVSPDGSYLIFCGTHNDGLGRGDLYISFKKKNGEWGESINMGRPVNDEGHQLCPFITRDGKYLFYTSKQDIYWVSTAILDQYREE